MKHSLIRMKNATLNSWVKLYAAAMTFAGMLVARPALALTGENLSTPKATTKFSDVATNLDGASQTMAALLIQFVSVGGFVVVAVSLYQLYKASKDEREKPMSAIVGLFIGGAMAAVGVIMWIMRNTVVGDGGTAS